MFLKIMAVLGVLIVGFLVFVTMKSSEMSIARELLIKAPPESIFPHINNSKKSNDWMPWGEEDPMVKMVYSGPDEGLGATSTWDSPGKMGTGKAEIVETIPNQSVKTQLTYTKPMQMSQLAEVSLKATGEGTIVRWSVTGKNNFMGRLFCVFMDMDKLVGGQFEKGLLKLKAIVEPKP